MKRCETYRFVSIPPPERPDPTKIGKETLVIISYKKN